MAPKSRPWRRRFRHGPSHGGGGVISSPSSAALSVGVMMALLFWSDGWQQTGRKTTSSSSFTWAFATKWQGPKWTTDLSAASSATDDQVRTADVFSLDSIRSTLIRQEETIIFALIERAQYRQNKVVYQPGGFGSELGLPPGSTRLASENDEGQEASLSFLEYMLIGTEVLHCGVRRYTSPEEHAFFPERLPLGPMDALPELDYPGDLLDNAASEPVNFNPLLLQRYITSVLPALAREGDDEQHGSTVLADIAALQALSRRVHYGKFVAESKYRSQPQEYQRLVQANDDEGVMALLTNAAVEEMVLRRARLKAATYGREPLLANLPQAFPSQDPQHRRRRQDVTSIVAAAAAAAVVAAVDAMGNEFDNDLKGEEQDHTAGAGRGDSLDTKVDPAVIEGVYRDLIIPLTKDIEVAYLFRRCGKEPPAKYGPDRLSTDS